MNHTTTGGPTSGDPIPANIQGNEVTAMDVLRSAVAAVEQAEAEVARAKSSLAAIAQSIADRYGPFKRGDRILYRGEKGTVTQCGCTWDAFLQAPRWGVVVCLDSEDVEFQLWGGQLAGLVRLTHDAAEAQP